MSDYLLAVNMDEPSADHFANRCSVHQNRPGIGPGRGFECSSEV